MWYGTYMSSQVIEVSIHQQKATLLSALQQSGAMWMWSGTCVTYRRIEVSTHQQETMHPSERQHCTVAWMWCGTCVSCHVIEVSIHQNCISAIREAAAHGYVDVVRYLCDLPPDRGVDPSELYNSAIREAAAHGHVDVVRYLCGQPRDRGVDPSARDDEAILFAAQNGHVDMVRYLCDLPPDRGVDPSARDNHALKQAALHGHVDVVRYLCDRPPDRGVDLRTCRSLELGRWHGQVARCVGCLPVMQSNCAAATVHDERTMAHRENRELGYICETMTARRAARLPVLALCALVREPHDRGRPLVCAGECRCCTGGAAECSVPTAWGW